jgi:hypothetical protein
LPLFGVIILGFAPGPWPGKRALRRFGPFAAWAITC